MFFSTIIATFMCYFDQNEFVFTKGDVLGAKPGVMFGKIDRLNKTERSSSSSGSSSSSSSTCCCCCCCLI